MGRRNGVIAPRLRVLGVAVSIAGCGYLFGLGSLDASAASRVPGWQGASSGQNPACALLTVDELRKLTGFQGYNRPSPGDGVGQGVGGGASCQYEAPAFTTDNRGNPITPAKAPLLSIVLIEGKNYTQTVPIRQGCKKEAAAGIGDAAFFEVCPASRLARTAPLYVKAGSKDLVFQMDIQSPDTEATLRPKIIAVAKAAAAKVK